MAKADAERSAFEAAARRHMEFAEHTPEWMGRAVLALMPWNRAEVTLQHAVAIALQEAYQAGQRGDVIEPIDFIDYYAKPHAPVQDDHATRIVRTRIHRTPSADSSGAHDAGIDGGSVHAPRISRSHPAPTTARVSRTAPQPSVSRVRRTT